MATITLVGAGGTATAVNASVTPTAHASTAAGDVVLVHASIRNSGTGVPVAPAGWTTLVLFGNEAFFAKQWQVGDTNPVITFTGGVANADTIAQIVTLRGVSLESLVTLVSATQLNGSAQDIAYPALTVAKDRHIVIFGAWKQDDVTTFGTPATMTALNSVTGLVAGDDAGQTLRYVIQTAAANIASGTLTITGGAAAISRAILLALKPAASIAVMAQDVFPPRVLVSVTDLTLGDAIDVYRVVSGARTLLRAGSSASVTDPSFLVTDAELPFGVPVSYLAVVNGIEYATASTAYTLPGGKVVVTDAITGLVAEAIIHAWPQKTYERDASTFRPGGRNVAVLGALAGFTGTIELFAQTTLIRDNIMGVLAGATQGTVQIRQPGGYDGVDCYVAVLTVTEPRFSQDGSDERRWLSLDALEVEGWAPSLAARGFTLQDLADLYTGLTLADLSADYATLLALALADLS
jgi:hypothetical protein